MSRLKYVGEALPEIVNPADFGNVAVLAGGRSSEREISLKTGNAVHAALVRRDVRATLVDPAQSSLNEIADAHYDRAFIALHGPGGEDGAMQGALEWLGIPYTGSGVLGSALCMDKLRTKQIALAAGVPTPDWVRLDSSEAVDGALERLGLPLIVKPASQGSSVGMSRVEEAGDLVAAWRAASALDPVVIAERCVVGSEYISGGTTQYHLPCGLARPAEAELQRLAMLAFRAAGAAGWGRVDFMIGSDARPMLLEVNTVPGMTDTSLVPMAAKACGMSFEQLVWRVLETSFMREPAR